MLTPRPSTFLFAKLEAPKTWMAGTSPAIAMLNTIGCEEATANSYFFAGGAILESAGLVSAASAGLSMRSIFAASRSLAT